MSIFNCKKPKSTNQPTSINKEIQKMEDLLSGPSILRNSQLYSHQLHLKNQNNNNNNKRFNLQLTNTQIINSLQKNPSFIQYQKTNKIFPFFSNYNEEKLQIKYKYIFQLPNNISNYNKLIKQETQ